MDEEGCEFQVLQSAVKVLPATTMVPAAFSRFVVDPFSRQLQPLSAASQRGFGYNQLWI